MKLLGELSYSEQLSRVEKVLAEVLPQYAFVPAGTALLQFENNAVYEIATVASVRFIVRIAAPWSRDEAEQRSELLWLTALVRYTGPMAP